MSRFLTVGVVVGVLAALLAMATPASAARHEQIVFSGEANGTFAGVSTDVGFWIWCAVDEAGNYDDCNGAIHFDALMPSKHVAGEVAETGEDVYAMDVSSSDGSVDCTLTNTPPITSGPTNTVTIACSSPSGTAVTSTAVVTNNG
jgi:hypothetical protein